MALISAAVTAATFATLPEPAKVSAESPRSESTPGGVAAVKRKRPADPEVAERTVRTPPLAVASATLDAIPAKNSSRTSAAVAAAGVGYTAMSVESIT
jgi:hypothetical protein